MSAKTRLDRPAADAPKFRLKDGAPTHYIGGQFLKAGAVVSLPVGVKPGKWLEPLDAPKAAEETAADDAEKPAKAEKAEKSK